MENISKSQLKCNFSRYLKNFTKDKKRELRKFTENSYNCSNHFDSRLIGFWEDEQSLISIHNVFTLSQLFGDPMQTMLFGPSSGNAVEFISGRYITETEYEDHIPKVLKHILSFYFDDNIGEMASILSVSATCVKKWMDGSGISTLCFCEIASHLEVPVDYLFFKDFTRHFPLSQRKTNLHFPEYLHLMADLETQDFTGSIVTKEGKPKLACTLTSPITHKKYFICEAGTCSRDTANNSYILIFEAHKDMEKFTLRFELFGNYNNQYNVIGGIGHMQIDTSEMTGAKSLKYLRETKVFGYSILHNELRLVYKRLTTAKKMLELSGDLDKMVYHEISLEAARSIKEQFGPDISTEDIENISAFFHIPVDRCEKLVRKYIAAV